MSDNMTEKESEELLKRMFGGDLQAQMIASLKAQYMFFGPALILAGEGKPKSFAITQLFMVLIEFIIGLPVKLFNYWRASVFERGTPLPWYIKLVVAIVSPIPAVLAFVFAFINALWGAVIARSIEFRPLKQIIAELEGEQST